ncbi:MAG: acyl-CoA dehydrogenase family protein [Pseudomonadota bacterium]|nr:acyl-CoA dehydrogenase family protein [Pseudomonadota bacterium]
MNLHLSRAEEAFRQTIRAWVREHLPQATAQKVMHGQRLGKEDIATWSHLLGGRGWLGHTWPARFGGPGWTPVQKFLFELECAAAGAPKIPPFGVVMVAPIIMEFGTAEQHQRFLPPLARGETWWCQGYSEPDAGSDLASLRTRAVLQGDHYVVNGQKTWTTYAQHADWIFCLVRTSTEGKPQAGISFLLIDMKTPGITVRPIRLLDGECEVNEVFFSDVRVPVVNRIGEENQGWRYAKYLLSHERTTIADVNTAKRELARLKRLARDAGTYDDTRFRDDIAHLEIDIIALEMLVLRVLWAETSGRNSLDIAALLKIRGSEVRQRFTELMMLAAGTGAVSQDLPADDASAMASPETPQAERAALATAYLNMRKTTIYGGSNEVQRSIVAQSLLD